MNFENDLVEIAKLTLDSYEINHDDLSKDYNIVWRWLNVELKLIPPQIRNVLLSDKIQVSQFLKTYQKILDEIVRKFKSGEDVNKYLSKGIFKEDYTDFLFFDWGIYHMHLGEEDPKDYFVKRAAHLLFIAIENKNVYFIDILPHNESYVFDQKKILEILCDNWPDRLDKYKINAIDVQPVIDAPEDIHMLRKAGISVAQKIGNNIYLPRGGGITSAGTGINVTIFTDKLFKDIRILQKAMEDRLSQIATNLNIPIEKVTLKLILYKNRMHVLEISSQTLIQ